MQKWLLSICLIFCLILVWISVGCDRERPSPGLDVKITLRWSKIIPQENHTDLKTGLIWAFSYLGAKLPKGSFETAFHPIDSSRFSLDIVKLGFEKQTLNSIHFLIGRIKQSDEYQKMGGIDIGRFLLYVAHSSWHYFQITDAPASVDFWLENPGFNPFFSFHLSHSIIAKKERKIIFSQFDSYKNLVFIGMEGTGSLAESTFSPTSYEVITLMQNGQLRFSVYGNDRKLETAVDSSLSLGGKPGKCQWCHEKELVPLYLPSIDYQNSMGREEFLIHLTKAQKFIKEYRQGLNTDITYENPQDHELAELLVLGFEEPSLLHLSQEWNLPIERVTELLKHIPTHISSEHPHLGPLYFRKEVENFSPYMGIGVPEHSRENSSYEPDLLGLSLK